MINRDFYVWNKDGFLNVLVCQNRNHVHTNRTYKLPLSGISARVLELASYENKFSETNVLIRKDGITVVYRS